MLRSWQLYLEDMIELLEQLIEYKKDVPCFEDFVSDRKTRDAILRNLELLGEATKGIPDQIRKDYGHIPWREIICVRNILAHVYFDVDDSIIWEIITQELHTLLETAKSIYDKHFG